MTRKTTFFEEWSSFRKVWGLIPKFADVTGEKLVRGVFSTQHPLPFLPHILYRVNRNQPETTTYLKSNWLIRNQTPNLPCFALIINTPLMYIRKNLLLQKSISNFCLTFLCLWCQNWSWLVWFSRCSLYIEDLRKTFARVLKMTFLKNFKKFTEK